MRGGVVTFRPEGIVQGNFASRTGLKLDGFLSSVGCLNFTQGVRGVRLTTHQFHPEAQSGGIC
jgi:hypothetical protein